MGNKAAIGSLGGTLVLLAALLLPCTVLADRCWVGFPDGTGVELFERAAIESSAILKILKSLGIYPDRVQSIDKGLQRAEVTAGRRTYMVRKLEMGWAIIPLADKLYQIVAPRRLNFLLVACIGGMKANLNLGSKSYVTSNPILVLIAFAIVVGLFMCFAGIALALVVVAALHCLFLAGGYLVSSFFSWISPRKRKRPQTWRDRANANRLIKRF